MKNIEKYHYTQEALDVYNSLSLNNVPFDEWLEREYEGTTLLEAATKREREATSEKSSAVGNAAAMRETLLRCDAMAQMPEIREYTIVKEMRNSIKKALAAPPRNFDRYKTAESAIFAFRKMCKERECSTCPFEDDRNYPFSCYFDWPYEDSRFTWVYVEGRKEAKK